MYNCHDFKKHSCFKCFLKNILGCFFEMKILKNYLKMYKNTGNYKKCKKIIKRKEN